MTVVLSHQTALREYFENTRWGSLPKEPLPAVCRASEKEVAAALDALGRPVQGAHVLVSEGRLRNKPRDGVSYHVAPSAHPVKTVVDVGDCLLASPELCFLQVSPLLDFEQLVLLGYALCGNYDQRDREPITSVEALREFALGSPGARGRKSAMAALRYVLDGSRSPMESRLAMMLTFPTRQGGFGLPMPQMNVPIPGTSRKGDLCWMEEKLIVEYDSRQFHADLDAQERDSVRRTEIGARGYRVVTVARSQLADERLLCKSAAYICKELGCDTRRCWEKYQGRRHLFHRQLMYGSLPPLFPGFRA